jgi:predicted MPP superfamily phosphohydrolase
MSVMGPGRTSPGPGPGGLGLLSLGLLSLGFFGYAALIEHRCLRLVRRRVGVPGLPAALAGLRVLHLSDLHVGARHSGARHLRAAAAALPADLIVVTGDLVHGTRTIARCAELLGELEAPLGVYAVLGNHDYSYPHCRVNTAALVAAIEERGVRVLRNSAEPVSWRGATLWLAGVDDPHRRHHDLAATLSDIPDDACTLLLAHSPDVLAELEPGRVALALVGHTHGGQVRLPGLPAIVTRTRLRLREPYGLRRLFGTLVHFHSGMGSPTPLRFRMPPEAALLELVPAEPCEPAELAVACSVPLRRME